MDGGLHSEDGDSTAISDSMTEGGPDSDDVVDLAVTSPSARRTAATLIVKVTSTPRMVTSLKSRRTRGPKGAGRKVELHPDLPTLMMTRPRPAFTPVPDVEPPSPPRIASQAHGEP